MEGEWPTMAGVMVASFLSLISQKPTNMKYFALFLSALILIACSKKKELSQEDRERSEPLAANQIIENEHGGISFFPSNTDVKIEVEGVPTYLHSRRDGFFVEVDDLKPNTQYNVWVIATSAGIMDFHVEGFTAINTSKIFVEKGVAYPAGRTLIMTFHRGIIRYTFTKK